MKLEDIKTVEQDRRAKLDSIPNDVKQLAQDFETLGGNRKQLFEDVNTELVAEKIAREADIEKVIDEGVKA